MRSVPPFDGLIAFDATLRLGSTTAAAAELGLTQSAVSHRLRKLDGFLGGRLLRRSAGGLSPTPAGAALAAALKPILDDMAELRALCRAMATPGTLKVGVGQALADHWLVRRLPRFAGAHPGIAIELAAVESEARMRSLDPDVLVAWSPVAEARATSTRRLLARERVFPVAAPALLPGGRPLTDPQALRRLPILHKGPIDGSGVEWSWTTWFDRLAIPGGPPPGPRFTTIGTTIAAALQGTGVALARTLLVHDALAEGRLVRVLAPEWDMASAKAHFVRWPAALAGDARVAAFACWLAAEAAETCSP
ncbi:MAG: LysR substrate-binding domain-containing protein [Alphaproteobacteria bacterium]